MFKLQPLIGPDLVFFVPFKIPCGSVQWVHLARCPET